MNLFKISFQFQIMFNKALKSQKLNLCSDDIKADINNK